MPEGQINICPTPGSGNQKQQRYSDFFVGTGVILWNYWK